MIVPVCIRPLCVFALSLIAFGGIVSPAAAQVVLYQNDFNAGEASLAGLTPYYTTNSAYPATATVSVVNGQLKLATTGLVHAGVSRDLRTGNPAFRPRLHENYGLLTWSFNVSNQDGGFNNSFKVILATSSADPYALQSYGYEFGGGGYVGNRMILRRYSYGVGGGSADFVDILSGLGPLPMKGTYRITFDPATRVWSVYGSTGLTYADPTQVGTLLGSGVDPVPVTESLPYTMLVSSTTGAAYFDNFRVTLDLGANRAPVTRPDEARFNGESSLLIDALANDDDPEGKPLRIAAVSTPAHGTVEIVPGLDGELDKLRYTPSPGALYTGDSIVYTVSDSEGLTATGEVAIPPVTLDSGERIHLFVTPGETVTLSLREGLTEPGPWRVLSVQPPVRGTIDNGADDTLGAMARARYHAPADLFRDDQFTAFIINGNGLVLNRVVKVIPALKGRFEALFTHTESPRAVEGRFIVSLTQNRQFSARVQWRGKTIRFKGQLDAGGYFETYPEGPILQLREHNGAIAMRSAIPGFLNERYLLDGRSANRPRTESPVVLPSVHQTRTLEQSPIGWYAESRRVAYSAPGKLAGCYTMVLPASNGSATATGESLAMGHGWGVANLYSSGAFLVSGVTGDGFKFTGAGTLRSDRSLLFYGPIPSSRKEVQGGLAGQLLFRNIENTSDADGLLHWIPGYSPSAGDDVLGLARLQKAIFSRYTPQSGQVPTGDPARVLERSFRIPNAWFPVTLIPTGFTGARPHFLLYATVHSPSGRFRGSLAAPRGSVQESFSGVFFQKTRSASGTLMTKGRPRAVSM